MSYKYLISILPIKPQSFTFDFMSYKYLVFILPIKPQFFTFDFMSYKYLTLTRKYFKNKNLIKEIII